MYNGSVCFGVRGIMKQNLKMKITKILLFIAIIITIVWMVRSNFEYEPITVLIGFVVSLIALYTENRIQVNKIRIKGKTYGELSQSNSSGTNQGKHNEGEG